MPLFELVLGFYGMEIGLRVWIFGGLRLILRQLYLLAEIGRWESRCGLTFC